MISEKSATARALKSIAPDTIFVTDDNALSVYECDAYTAYRARPAMVALPATTEDVAAILRYASQNNIPVVPRGAGTSLVGGAMPKEHALMLGLSRMNHVVDYNPDDRRIRVQAGITNLMVSQLVADDKLFYAPDPSSQLACSIGGNVAMNSGGAHCLKYGVTTNNLLGLRLVTIEGEILDFSADDGLDLVGLLCGSEGQLGIITEAVLKLETKPEHALPMMLAFAAPEEAGECVAAIIRAGIIPVAIEYMDETMIREVEKFAHAGYPLCAALLIVEIEGSLDLIQLQMEQVSAIAEANGAYEIRIAENAEQGVKIWAGRKAAFGVMGKLADYITLDGVVPVSKLADALREITRLSAEHGLRVTNVFHAGDGNLHPLIMYDVQKDGELARAEALGAAILTACVEMGGCLTGEHGVGIEKRELMERQWNDLELERMMQIKDVFDPSWLLNPDKVFPLHLSEARRA